MHRLSRMTGVVVGRATAPPPRGRRARDPQRGSVLLETAIAIPLLIAVALALAWALSLGSPAMGLADAARHAAREIARGVPAADAVAAAQGAAPDAVIRVVAEGSMVTVVAETTVTAPVPVLRDLAVPLRQSVTIPAEWM